MKAAELKRRLQVVDDYLGRSYHYCIPPLSLRCQGRDRLTRRSLSFCSWEEWLLTSVYVDGFNLYYRAVRDTDFKWLDLRKLAELLFPEDNVRHILYFTAIVIPRSNDAQQQQRQQAYLRALSTLPELKITYGTFRSLTKRRPLVTPITGLPAYVEVRDVEEKGTDVNLATRLVADGFQRKYEQAIVLSNDSDLASAIRCVRNEIGLRVVLVNPDRKNHSPRSLSDAATYVRRLRKSHLRRSQFPTVLADKIGPITKPTTW